MSFLSLRTPGFDLNISFIPATVFTNTLTFTADAIVSGTGTNTKTFTTDGIVLVTNTKTFITDGIVKATQTKTFTVDGIVKATTTKTFTADAIVLVTATKTFTADGIVQVQGNTKTFTADGIVKVQTTKTFTTDGIVLITTTKTFTTDGIVQIQGNLKTFTTDGIVEALGSTKTFTTDAILDWIYGQTFDSGLIPTDWQEYGNSPWSYANSSATQTSVGSADPNKVLYTQSNLFPQARVVQIELTIAVLGIADDRIGLTILGDVSGGRGENLVLHNNNTLGFLDDGVAWGPNTTIAPNIGETWVFKAQYDGAGTFSGKAWLKGTTEPDWMVSWVRTPDVTHVLSGITGNSNGLTSRGSYDNFFVFTTDINIFQFTVDGIVKVLNNLKTFTTDGIVLTTQTKTFTTDGIVQIQGNQKTFTVDGIVIATVTFTFTTDGIVKAQNLKTFTTDGIVLVTQTKTFTVDGIVLATKTQTFTTDGIVKVTTNEFPTIFVNESMWVTPATGTIKNNASWLANYLLLTGNSGSENGEFEYTGVLPTNFEIDFEFWMGPNNPGADAIWFYWGDNSTPTGEDDAVGGYHVIFDEYNGEGLPYQIRFNGSILANTTGTATFADSAWHQAKIRVVGNTITMFLDQVQVLTVTDSQRILPGSLFGWGSRTGGVSNEHRIRNVFVGQFLTVDGIVKAIQAQTFTIDGIVESLSNLKTFTTDGIVFATNTKTFTVDALVNSGNFKTFTTDGVIQVQGNLKTFTVDAIVQIQGIVKTFTTDGIVKAIPTQTFTVDALVQVQGNLKTFTTDGIVLVVTTKTFTIDAEIETEGNTKTFTTDGIVFATNFKSFTVDGDVEQFGETKTFTADGIVKVQTSFTYTVDGIVRSVTTKTFITDGVVLVVQTKTFTTDGDVFATNQLPFTVDGIILATNTFTFTTDGTVQLPTVLHPFSVDGFVKLVNSSIFGVDAIISPVKFGPLGGQTDPDTWLGKDSQGLWSKRDNPKSLYEPISPVHSQDETPRLVNEELEKLDIFTH